MSADDEISTRDIWPRELTPEEAARKRDYHLALAKKMALSAEEPYAADSDANESTLATFILPGD